MKEISLNGKWELRKDRLKAGNEIAKNIAKLNKGWLPVKIPGDIHEALISAGKIKEPLIGRNCYECEWTEKYSWWFRKKFNSPRGYLKADKIELELNGLDSNALIFLNNEFLGSHKNAFRPFIKDVKKILKIKGENTLLIRLTMGLEDITNNEIDSMTIKASTVSQGKKKERGDLRRPFVRKPQYLFGWDWSPRVASTAIGGDVKLRMIRKACIRSVYVVSEKDKENANLNILVNIEYLHYWKSQYGEISISIIDEKGNSRNISKKILLKSGMNYNKLNFNMKNPKLWWPNGLGDQHLYTVNVSLKSGNIKISYPAFQYGIRFIEWLDVDTFALKINDKKIFCKGGNWVPADTIYTRITDEKYEKFILEAKKANFNMLRIWGGGLYEPDIFYELCNKYGILVWQDFMFACSPYPDYIDEFNKEVEKEAEYQVVRLRNHACLALWCGSNENTVGFKDWWNEKTQDGAYIYNYLLPDVVNKNSPNISYWTSSPYGGENTPNALDVGDCHYWKEIMGKRITPELYDECASLFVSEYGFSGPCSKESTKQYLGSENFDFTSPVWRHHVNTFEKDIHTIDMGIKKHYLKKGTITPDDYFLYGGLYQGLMYGYSFEAMRFRAECHGVLFWMYNDCWGEVGWTIIDYYAQRKISWYFTKRAFAPVRIIMREKKGGIHVVIANDSLKDIKGRLEYGFISLDGKQKEISTMEFNAKALARTCILQFKRRKKDITKGVWFARVKNNPDVLHAVLRLTEFKKLKLVKPKLKFKINKVSKGIWCITVSSDVYAHAVHFNLPASAEPEDSYFDLLPGETRKINVLYDGNLSINNFKIRNIELLQIKGIKFK